MHVSIAKWGQSIGAVVGSRYLQWNKTDFLCFYELCEVEVNIDHIYYLS